MSQLIAASTGALTAVLVGATGFARAWPGPGRHRAPAVRSVLDEKALDAWLGPWPEPARGDVVTQQWFDCPGCGTAEPGIRIKDGWWCGHCLHPVTTDMGDFL